MGNRGTFAAGLCLMLAVSACSSGSGKVLVQGSQAPPIPTSSASATPAARPKQHSPVPTTAATVRTATTGSATPQATATPRTKPKPTPTKSAGQTSACTTQGPTTNIQMVTGYRFSPSTVTINRCDAVKAVYADTSGAPHNWTGAKWHSPDMNSNGQSYTYRFTSSGTFNFYCSYHQNLGMTGTVTVR